MAQAPILREDGTVSPRCLREVGLPPLPTSPQTPEELPGEEEPLIPPRAPKAQVAALVKVALSGSGGSSRKEEEGKESQPPTIAADGETRTCPICLEDLSPSWWGTHSCRGPGCRTTLHNSCRERDLAIRGVDSCPTCRYSPDVNSLRDRAMKHRSRACCLLCLSLLVTVPTATKEASLLTTLGAILLLGASSYHLFRRTLRKGPRVLVWWLECNYVTLCVFFLVAFSLGVAAVTADHPTNTLLVFSGLSSALYIVMLVTYQAFSQRAFLKTQAMATTHHSPRWRPYIANPLVRAFPRVPSSDFLYNGVPNQGMSAL